MQSKRQMQDALRPIDHGHAQASCEVEAKTTHPKTAASVQLKQWLASQLGRSVSLSLHVPRKDLPSGHRRAAHGQDTNTGTSQFEQPIHVRSIRDA